MTAVGGTSPSGLAYVGRERELTELRHAVERAAGGRGQLVLLSGEAGIGKTRLGGEVADVAADAGFRVLWGRTWEGPGAPAYWCWVQVLRAYVRRTDEQRLIDEVGAGRPHIGRIVPELAQGPGSGESDTDADAEASRFLVFDAVATLLRNASAHQPLALVLDDLHWADVPSLLLLEFVVRQLDDAKVFVLGTYREAEVLADPPIAEVIGRLSRSGRHIPLRGLGRSDVAALIARIGVPTDDATVDEVLRISAGNPFFVDEVSRMLADGRGVSGSLPLGVQELVAGRLRLLPPAAVEVLRVGAVIGREFQLGMIEQVTGRPAEELVPLFSLASERGVLDPGAGSFGSYGFVHAIVRDALLATIPTAERAVLHLEVARALERYYGSSVEAHVDEVARHLLEAGPAALEDAVSYLIRAAHRARAQLAFEKAESCLRQAIDLLESRSASAARVCELLITLGEIQIGSGAYRPAVETFVRACEIAATTEDPRLIGHAAMGFADANFEAGEFEVEPGIIGLLRDALGRSNEPRLRSKMLGRLARAMHFFAPPSETIPLAREALSIAEATGEPLLVCAALSNLWWALLDAADHPERIGVSRMLMTTARAAASERYFMQGSHYHVSDLLQAGDVGAVDDVMAAAKRSRERVPLPTFLWQGPAEEAMRAIVDGRYDDACAATDEVARFARREAGSGLDFVTAWLTYYRELDRGDPDRMDRALAAVVPFAELFPFVRGAVVGHGMGETGRIEEARAAVDRVAVEDLGAIPRGLPWLPTMCGYAGASAVVGDVERAAALYDLLEPYASQMATTPIIASMPCVSHFLGMVAAACGRTDDARAHLTFALRRHERMGARPWVAKTSYELGRVLVAGGDPSRGRELLAAALTSAETLDMVNLARLARAALTKAPATVQVTPVLEGVLRLDGELWSAGRPGTIVHLQDSKGLRALHHLLSTPGVEIHASDLVAAIEGNAGPGASTRGVREAGLGAASGDAGPILDDAARSAYKARIAELTEELEEAEAFSDLARAERARAELDALTAELTRGFGLGGRARKASSTAERSRINVTRQIKRAIDAIGAQDAEIGRHLRTYVRTGVFCSYEPDPALRISWSL